MIFDICNKNYYSENSKLYETNILELKENNVYIFTGCNGIGKSTLIFQLTDDRDTSLNKFAYNLLADYNGYNSFAGVFGENKDKNDYDTFYLSINKRSNGWGLNSFESTVFSKFKSQGEKLIYNLIPCLEIIDKELATLKNKTLYLFLDDLDVGTSLDVISEEKLVIQNIVKKLKENNTKYVICIAANNYELTKLGICIDCVTLKTVDFHNYNDYYNYVVKTRRYKDTRNEKENIYGK